LKIVEEPTVWGGLQDHQTPRTDGICPAINAAAGMGGGHTPIITEPTGIYTNASEGYGNTPTESGLARCLRANNGRFDGVIEPKLLCPKKHYDENGVRSVEHTEVDISPTILAAQHKSGDTQPKVLELLTTQPMTDESGNRYVKHTESEVAQTLKCDTGDRANKVIENNVRIRKLTPLECYRLMGFDDEDVDKCRTAGVSNSQIYKTAGNSIVVHVLEHIFRQMLPDKKRGNNIETVT